MLSHCFLEGTVGKDNFDLTSDSVLFGQILGLSNYQAYLFTIVLSTTSGAWGLSKFWKFYILKGHAVMSLSFILTFGLCCLFCFRAAIGINLCVLASWYTQFGAFVRKN